MAQRAAKTLAQRNASTLLRTHIITILLHAVFLLFHWLFNRPRLLLPYCIFTFPTLAIEFYLERVGRPRYNSSDGSLRSPGENLAASGLTEYMWDVLYWTWGCIGAVCLFGDRAWWLWTAIPLYFAWLGWTIFMGLRSRIPGMGGSTGAADEAGSKRQRRLEKRGEQRVVYR